MIMAAATPGIPMAQMTRPWDDAYEQLTYERGACNLVQKYTPRLVRERVFAERNATLVIMGRGGEILLRLGMYFGGLLLDKLSGRDSVTQVQLRASQLRETLTALGPSFIKAGQVLASRPDIIREDYMNELCTLQDDVPSFPDVQAFQIMEEDLGRPIAAVFSSISEHPIAAASLGQVYKAILRDTGEEVAIKVQRPNVEPLIFRDLYIFRQLARFVTPFAMKKLGCNAELIVDEFGEKLLEELDYAQEARNIQDFLENFKNDPKVKIPWVRRDLCSQRVLVMEWINGRRCTDPRGIRSSGLNVNNFIRGGVVSALRQLLEFGLFHGDPHPGNIFAMDDGRIAYVDFGNVAELSSGNKQVLIDAVVHAVNEDYEEMARDFIKLGFLAPGTDITPIVPALEKIWADSLGQSMASFNFRTVTSKFNELVYQYPIRIPERYSLVIRSLLTQEGICLMLEPDFRFLEVAYPYVAKRLLTDEDPALRQRLIEVLFRDNKFQWKRLQNLIQLAKEGTGDAGLDLSDTLSDGARMVFLDPRLRQQLIMALTEDNRLHIQEVQELLALLQADINPTKIVQQTLTDLPAISRQLILTWSDRVLAS
jgi:predicted unusual protein kinase regulating ubiquinone biosynthesis (AarF/ABC1/UbiB family)